MNLLFNSDIVNLLLKISGVRDRGPNFTIFVGWSALIVSGWFLVAWGRRSGLGPAENASFVFLVSFKHIVLTRYQNMRGAFHQQAFFPCVPGVIKVRMLCWCKPRVTQGVVSFPQNLLRARW